MILIEFKNVGALERFLRFEMVKHSNDSDEALGGLIDTKKRIIAFYGLTKYERSYMLSLIDTCWDTYCMKAVEIRA